MKPSTRPAMTCVLIASLTLLLAGCLVQDVTRSSGATEATQRTSVSQSSPWFMYPRRIL